MRRDAVAMESTADRVQVSIEIEFGVEPLTGTIARTGARERGFIGWTGLAAALTLILDEAGAGSAQESPGAE